MAARLAPAGHYDAGSLAGDALHDLNTVDSRNAHVDAILDADRGVATGDDLENDNDSASAGDCGPHSYADIGLEEVDGPNLEQSLPLNNDGSQSPYGVLTINGEFFCQSLKWDGSTALNRELR
jgi:hypothetical protein